MPSLHSELQTISPSQRLIIGVKHQRTFLPLLHIKAVFPSTNQTKCKFFQINGEDVRQASHEKVVNLIRKSGDLVSLTVVTVSLSPAGNDPPNPGSPSTAANSQSRQYASTLPRKFQGRSMVQPPPPPKRDPNTTLSVGRARAKSMVANLAAIGELCIQCRTIGKN